MLNLRVNDFFTVKHLLSAIFVLASWTLMLPAQANTLTSDEATSYHFKYFGLSIYTIRLSTEAQSAFSQQDPFELAITYHRTVDKSHLVKHSVKEWKKQKLPTNIINKLKPTLESAMPSVAKADTLTFKVHSIGYAQLLHNNEVAFTFSDPQFIRAFADIWLGENTSQPKLRRALLGH